MGTGTRVLILGAGAVARAAQALAQARGASVVVGARRAEVVQELGSQGVTAFELQGEDRLAEQARDRFEQNSPEVVFDTTGYWLGAAINVLAPFGRVAVIAAPADGLVSTPVLDLYRRGGSIIGVNSLLYSLKECARMLEHIAAAFEDAIPLPGTFIELPLSNAIAAYQKLDQVGSEKVVLIP